MRRVILATAAVAASMTLVAAPAFAADPVGYALTWDSTTLYQLEEGVDAVEVDGSTGVEAVTGLDFDAEGNGYAITFNGQAQLWSVDITGQATLIGGIADADAASAENCTALDYTDGVISIACDVVGEDTYVFGTVDPTSALFSPVHTLPVRVASIAHNPVDDVMYGFGYDGDVLAITAGGVTEVGTFPGNDPIWGADFDSAGALWAAVDLADATLLGWTLVAFPASGFDGEFIENISVFEAVEPAIVVPAAAPELAATGMEDDMTVLVGLAAALALLSGITLAIVARRVARRS